MVELNFKASFLRRRESTIPLSFPRKRESTTPLSFLRRRESTTPLSFPRKRESTTPLSFPRRRESTTPLSFPRKRESTTPLSFPRKRESRGLDKSSPYKAAGSPQSTALLAFYLAIVIVLLFISSALAQTKALPRELRRASASPEEFVSMSRNMPFNQALPIFNDLSKRFISKEIIDQTPHTFPIGIDVDKMYWLDAMELILKSNDLWYREYANFMMIHPLDEAVKKETEGPIDTGRVVFETREVMISAVFFELNTTKVRESGFSWNIFSGQDTFSMTAGDNTGGLITAVVQEGYDFGSMVAVFRAMESRQIGEILASPQVTVRSKMDGSVQIGTDFSVNVQDFAGNTVTQLISTGVIMKVTPEIFTIDTLTFVNLKLDVQRSSGSTSEAGMTIAKTQAQTSVLLLDGEETIIGGLYSNKEIVLREGVPILKDLPWWIFGLRYLFGRNKTEIEQMELVILIRADLLPALNARILNRFQEIETKERMKNHLKQWKEKLGQMEEEKAKKK